MVPKTLEENLEWRRTIISFGDMSAEHGRAVWTACQNDLLLWVNSAAWTYDPRRIDDYQNPVVPFITYDYQDDAFLEMKNCLGKRDICFKKSRDMGLSWMLLTLFTHEWIFSPIMVNFLLVSRNEDYVDKSGNQKSLFWKIDFLLDRRRMPRWLIPNYTRTKMRLTNNDSESMIDGESTTGDVARGDRRTAIAMDEFAAFEIDDGYKALAATMSSTNCRIFNSTPQGMGNAFADVAHNPKMTVIAVHWSQHPEKRRGLYRYTEAGLEKLDPDYAYDPNYPYRQDGKLRSPWYDSEEDRSPTPQLIAQELDIDFHGSAVQFFEPQIVSAHINEHCCPPIVEGELEYDRSSGEPMGFDPIEGVQGGMVKLWVPLDASNRPILPSGSENVVGADIASGTGATNSVAVAANRVSRQKFLEIATAHMSPDDFAALVVAVCRWLNDAFLIWEANGPGRPFGARVLELGYRSIYYRRQETKIGRPGTDFPGWWNDKSTKRVLMQDYKRSLSNASYINPSLLSLEESRHYVYLPDGTIVHSGSISTIDPSGARENHGDRVMADALACRGLGARKQRSERVKAQTLPGSLAHRRLEADREQRARSYW